MRKVSTMQPRQPRPRCGFLRISGTGSDTSDARRGALPGGSNTVMGSRTKKPSGLIAGAFVVHQANDAPMVGSGQRLHGASSLSTRCCSWASCSSCISESLPWRGRRGGVEGRRVGRMSRGPMPTDVGTGDKPHWQAQRKRPAEAGRFLGTGRRDMCFWRGVGGTRRRAED